MFWDWRFLPLKRFYWRLLLNRIELILSWMVFYLMKNLFGWFFRVLIRRINFWESRRLCLYDLLGIGYGFCLLGISFKSISFSKFSESTQLIFTLTLYLYPAWCNDSTTDIYASCNSVYLPTKLISISFFKLSTVLILAI